MINNSGVLSVVCFKWTRQKSGFRIPHNCDYSAKHVNIFYNMIERNLTIPHRFICVTDNKEGINKEIEIVDMWDDWMELGGCYCRLKVFSKEMREILGDRFVCLDLDCIIVGNLDKTFSRREDFVILKYPYENSRTAICQYYGGGLIMMDAGCRSFIWENFTEQSTKTTRQRSRDKQLVGSDQAWISHCLDEKEAVFSLKDGVYNYSMLKQAYSFKQGRLPSNAKIIQMPGQYDPSLCEEDFLRKFWR